MHKTASHLACPKDCNKIYDPFEIMTITAQILDFNTNLPVENVNVFYKNNTQIGTTTNADGKFSLQAVPNEDIVFSHVGFQNETYKASQIEAVEYMMPETNLLDEVVVFAKKKKNWFIAGLLALGIIVVSSNSDDENETVKTKI
jgi:hypothetical protein